MTCLDRSDSRRREACAIDAFQTTTSEVEIGATQWPARCGVFQFVTNCFPVGLKAAVEREQLSGPRRHRSLTLVVGR